MCKLHNGVKQVYMVKNKFSRNQINKCGEILLSSSNSEEVKEAEKVINEWRCNHTQVLQQLNIYIDEFFVKQNVKYSFSSKRIKRMTSIKDKLDENEDMRLGGLQDIGGLRYVFESIDDVESAYRKLKDIDMPNFTLKKFYDYIESPKLSGYRSIHIVYKYTSEDERYSGLQVELQLRTRLQHCWATAVETGELITSHALKSSLGDESWLTFFKLVGALFALKEQRNLPLWCTVKKEDSGKRIISQEIKEKIKAINDKNQFLNQLYGFQSTINVAEQNKYPDDYYLIENDTEKKWVEFTTYRADEYKKACDAYQNKEEYIEMNNLKRAVVLVSVDDIKVLRDAYPSYFYDSKLFINSVESMINE